MPMNDGLKKCKDRAMKISGTDSKGGYMDEDMADEEKARRVKTPDGSRRFGQPIGSIIKPDLIPGKKPNMSGGTSAKPTINNADVKPGAAFNARVGDEKYKSKLSSLKRLLASKYPDLKFRINDDDMSNNASINVKLGRNKKDNGNLVFYYMQDNFDRSFVSGVHTVYDDEDMEYGKGVSFKPSKEMTFEGIEQMLKDAIQWAASKKEAKVMEFAEFELLKEQLNSLRVVLD